MRLKVSPTDFVVREATDLRIKQTLAPYRVYMLEKQDWNTADALIRIARAAGVPYDRIAYGGKKDRHAHTVQFVTADSPRDLSTTEKGYTLKQIGYSAEPMGPNRIIANQFTITVREMTDSEVERVMGRLDMVQRSGVPNYFDDQRFGTLDKERGFIAERMLQGKWEEALNLAITTIHPEEHTDAKRRKRAIREAWGDWVTCRQLATTAFEQRSFDLLIENPRGFREALATAHRETATMWVSAYQSYIWNEMVRRLLAARGIAGPTAPGVAGPYRFFASDGGLPEELMIPLPGKGMRFADDDSAILLEEVLRERRLRPASLENQLLPGIAFKSSLRPVAVVPRNLSAQAPEPDERYPGHQKLTLGFSLPRGSYATMITKGLAATDGK